MNKPSLSASLGCALVAIALGTPLAARAQQVYKCPQANGAVAFQSTPCPTNEKPQPRPTAAQLNAQRVARPKDDKPYDDPYASSVDSRPHPQAPAFVAPGRAAPPAPASPQGQSTSSLVADTQARNKRENAQQAYEDAHRNDKHVDVNRCNLARHNLGVLKEQQRAFSYDNKGNRVYVDDKERAATIAQNEQEVAAYCP